MPSHVERWLLTVPDVPLVAWSAFSDRRIARKKHVESLWKRVLNVKSSFRDRGLGIETWAEKESSVC